MVSGSRGDGAVYDLCKRIGNEGILDTTYAECQQPLRGRYVRLERLPNGSERNIINLCEIQVYGYLYLGNAPIYHLYIVGYNHIISCCMVHDQL